MSPTVRLIAASITLVFAFTRAPWLRAGAAPTFSEWAVPTNLGPTVNSPFQDFGPAISKDGRSLYFTSDRPGGFGSFDIWVARRADDDGTWGSPMNLGGIINTGATENVPALSRDGHWLFFNSNRPGGLGLQDIWVSWRRHTHDDFGWEAPVNLGPGVNTSSVDVNPSFLENAHSGAPVLFFTSNRPGSSGGFDVYVSPLTRQGVFGPPTLVPELSSPAQEQRPSVRRDGLEIFFHSDRPGTGGNDLWVSTRNSATEPWSTPQNLGSNVNTTFADQQPYITSDWKTLLLVSDRPGGFGALDLYVTTRTKDSPSVDD
jgi:Tol biopolymer transport system component